MGSRRRLRLSAESSKRRREDVVPLGNFDCGMRLGSGLIPAERMRPLFPNLTRMDADRSDASR